MGICAGYNGGAKETKIDELIEPKISERGITIR